MIGLGGIGSGSFFAIEGKETLGREESRGGRFLDRRDYCKLHIVTHYISRLSGQCFKTMAVGMVGSDEAGHRLLGEMKDAGIDIRYVETLPDAQTLFSFCFVYPDGSGGNLTTTDSACSRVDPSFVKKVEAEFSRLAGRGIALALPEVPLDARRALLEMGTVHRFLRAASFTSEEIPEVLAGGLLGQVDLLALNQDEARVILNSAVDEHTPGDMAEKVVFKLSQRNPGLWISITAGCHGSWGWDGSELQHLPAVSVPAVNTAGAGDAHLAGIIVGLIASLSLLEAQQLGNLVAGFSVTSPHTIHDGICPESLQEFGSAFLPALSSRVRDLLSL